MLKMFMIAGFMWLEKRVTIYPNANSNEAISYRRLFNAV